MGGLKKKEIGGPSRAHIYLSPFAMPFKATAQGKHLHYHGSYAAWLYHCYRWDSIRYLLP